MADAVQQLIAESEAMTAALAHVEGRGPSQEQAASKVEQALRGHKGDDLEAVVVRFAMEHIAGYAHDPAPEIDPVRAPIERRIFEVTAQAWIQWLLGGAGVEQAREALCQLQEDSEGYQPQGGALHLMALRPWQLAVQALLEGDREEAQRLFRRSTELGSQYGIETNPVVQWTYAASFFG